MGKTVPVRVEAAALSPLEVKCLENVQPNQECSSAQLEVVAPDKTFEPTNKLCLNGKRKRQQVASNGDSDDSDSEWTPLESPDFNNIQRNHNATKERTSRWIWWVLEKNVILERK